MEPNIMSNPDDDPAFDIDPDGDAAAYDEWAAVAGEPARPPPEHPQRDFADGHRCGFIAPSLHEQVENLAFVVNRAPEPELPARDRHGHFIKMSPRGWPRASTPKFSGEQRPELQYPSSHRFVGDIQTALRKQIFDVAIAERETHIEPNGVPDDRRRELMVGKRDRRAPSYPTTGCALPST
jgi:hypothetical protein